MSPVVCIFPWRYWGGGAGIWFFNTRHLHIYATKCLLWYIPCVLSGYLIVLTLLTSTFAAQNVTHGMHIPWCRGGYLIVVIPVTSTFTAHDVTGSIFPFVLGGYFFDTRHPPPNWHFQDQRIAAGLDIWTQIKFRIPDSLGIWFFVNCSYVSKSGIWFVDNLHHRLCWYTVWYKVWCEFLIPTLTLVYSNGRRLSETRKDPWEFSLELFFRVHNYGSQKQKFKKKVPIFKPRQKNIYIIFKE
jgi:hypothetical protein